MKNTKFKKLLSVLLAVVMLTSCGVLFVSAAGDPSLYSWEWIEIKKSADEAEAGEWYVDLHAFVVTIHSYGHDTPFSEEEVAERVQRLYDENIFYYDVEHDAVQVARIDDEGEGPLLLSCGEGEPPAKDVFIFQKTATSPSESFNFLSALKDLWERIMEFFRKVLGFIQIPAA